MKRHGWWDKCYIKTADEPKYDAESARKLRVIADLIHEADPDYKILLTVNVPVKDATWAGVTDYWCPLINFIPMPLGDSPLAKVVSEAKSRGGEMWTYTCCWPPPPWVNVAFIEEDAMAHRALPLMCMRYGAAGYLYWGMKWWPPENFADKDWHGARKPLWPLQPWHSRLGELPAGDGYIAYPDGRGGPLPSIRAMLFRDGVEDCQYVKLLERRGKRPALETMFPDGCHYPSAAELLRWRREAARVVEGR